MDRSSEDYWPHVHAHIDALLDRPIEEHEAYLDANCPDQAMRRDVKSWLAYIYTPTDVLDQSVATYARALLDDGPPPARPPLWSAGGPSSTSESTSSHDAQRPAKSQSDSSPTSHSDTKAEHRPINELQAAWPLWTGAALLGVFILWWSFSS